MRGALLIACLLACGSAAAAQRCKASFYGSESGRVTASGARFNPMGISAAHKTLPFGTRVLVTRDKRSVVVPITDRGPFVRGRCIDVTRKVARILGFERAGTAEVTIEPLARWGH